VTTTGVLDHVHLLSPNESVEKAKNNEVLIADNGMRGRDERFADQANFRLFLLARDCTWLPKHEATHLAEDR
jgi:hypothetical protein